MRYKLYVHRIRIAPHYEENNYDIRESDSIAKWLWRSYNFKLRTWTRDIMHLRQHSILNSSTLLFSDISIVNKIFRTLFIKYWKRIGTYHCVDKEPAEKISVARTKEVQAMMPDMKDWLDILTKGVPQENWSKHSGCFKYDLSIAT